MKLNKWLLGAMAFSLLTACSDNDLTDKNGSGGSLNQTKDGVAYLGISLELPSESATRGENDIFDDGIQSEYTIDHAAILLFRGAEEASAKFVGAYKLGTDQAFDQPNGDQVTLSFQKSISVLNPPVLGNGESLWGLAIVNYSTDIFKISDNPEESEDYGDLIVKNGQTDENEIDLVRVSEAGNGVEATTFSDFRGYTTTSSFIRSKTNTFFMTNAPLSDKPGTLVAPAGAKIQTLTKLNTNFYDTEAEAIQKPAGCIFVERAVAKITCSKFSNSVDIPYTKVEINEDGVPEYSQDPNVKLIVKSVEWLLDNEERSSFIVRNATTENSFWPLSTSDNKNQLRWRFIGNIGMNDNQYDPGDIHDPNNSTWYRTYWCIDPNYGGDLNKDFNDQANNDPKYIKFNQVTGANGYFLSEKPIYSHENTFDVKHQSYKNTTRVIFKVKYSVEGNDAAYLYAVRGQLQTFYLAEDAKNLIKRSVLGSTRLHDLIVKFKKDATLNYTEDNFDMKFEVADKDDVDEESGIQLGDYILKSITITPDFISEKFKELSEADKAEIANTLSIVATSANSSNHIVPFKDNECYYAVYIKHFGDTYCPLPEEWIGSRVETVYPDLSDPTKLDEAKYLGRYGLVRNNWYDLQVGLITRLGTAKVPNGNTDDSDDNKSDESFLSARVHVLSWAKRTQQVDF